MRYDVSWREILNPARRLVLTMDDSEYSLVDSAEQTRLRGEHFVKHSCKYVVDLILSYIPPRVGYHCYYAIRGRVLITIISYECSGIISQPGFDLS